MEACAVVEKGPTAARDATMVAVATLCRAFVVYLRIAYFFGEFSIPDKRIKCAANVLRRSDLKDELVSTSSISVFTHP